MATPPTPRHLLEEAATLFAEHGSYARASDVSGIPKTTIKNRVAAAKKAGIKIARVKDIDDVEILRNLLRIAEAENKANRRDRLSDEWIKKQLFKLRDHEPDPPRWLVAKAKRASSPGVPTLFGSDWHWGEVVESSQIGGVNAYDLKIAHSRAQALIENAIVLLRDHLAYPDYPGIVFALGGDMVSGDIHEELSATNEVEIMPCVLDLVDVLVTCIDMLQKEFGQVFLPCVTGNHGRNTKKIRAKGRHHTSFDWLIYQFLRKHYEKNQRVSFLIPDGPDAYYRIHGHRYLLTHGDQFRGGDGLIGPLGPIFRGDHKKRSRNSAIDLEYDTLILGHHHRLMQLRQLIVNGSLIGYNEYAFANNFPFEPPAQGLWITHPRHGITFSLPVYPERKQKPEGSTQWVSVSK